MIAQAIVTKNNKVLMVRQFVQRGAIVWNFPGGGIEEGESPEEACVREVHEETGYIVKINRLLYNDSYKFTFIAEIVGGEMFLNKELKDNDDILEVSWVSLDDNKKWDQVTLPILEIYINVTNEMRSD
ncbi:NUDIX hydrolase [Aquibacillus koreensis]|uniref:NUDIX hydrolase n=1 Tax=Aquibacillus koreensis TaxID=279446 RepID=A0A9X3WMR3_9BACI|nr:NUDIX hydrolase [Aquibacillus koreensis]MCT2534373.1 NUDIX hydrolase [Aquibacillus koreensis]MDC3421680.1 NUDIX hydrolase [Aquibacillus koreensis]